MGYHKGGLKMENRLQSAFSHVREVYFPRWDKEGKWAEKYDLDLPSQGRCADEKKQIIVSHVNKNDDDLHMLLIHEIAHAVTNGGHGKKWQERYRKAGKKAEEIGRKNLAEKVYEDIEMYINAHCEKCSAATINDQIRDWVLDMVTEDKLVPPTSFEYGFW